MCVEINRDFPAFNCFEFWVWGVGETHSARVLLSYADHPEDLKKSRALQKRSKYGIKLQKLYNQYEPQKEGQYQPTKEG